MELANLDFESTLIPEEVKETNPPKLTDRQDTLNTLQEGMVQYDPREKALLFYDTKNNYLFMAPLSELSIKSELLNKNIISFDYKYEGRKYQFKIFNQSKETLGERTLQRIVNLFYKQQIKKEKDQNSTKKIYQNILTTPTNYQLELLQQAKEKNIIVFLETGLGKTYISILLIKDIFGEPLSANRNNFVAYEKKTKKKVLCLFKTVSLLLQQSKVIKHNTNLKILKIYGSNETSVLHVHEKFRKTLNKYDIICATPEAIYRSFTFGYLKSDDLALVVLDECHHCKKDDFYNRLMKHFIFFNKDSQNDIKILGLTASPCAEKVSNEKQLIKSIEDLCNNMNCHISCPSNIITTGNSSEIDIQNELNKLHFLYLSNENDELDELDKQKKIKEYLFNSIILPILDYHYKPIFDELTSIFKIKKDDEENEPKVPVEKTEKEIIKEKKEKKIKKEFEADNTYQIQMNICLIIMSHYLTLFVEDENKLDEKFMGIFTKNDVLLLEEYKKDYFSSKKINENYFVLKKFIDSILKRFNDILNENPYNNGIINISLELREFYKRFKEDNILTKIKNYCRNINLIIKILDIQSIYDYTNEYFIKENELRDSHIFELNDIDDNDDNNDESKNFYLKISKKFLPIKAIKDQCPNYKSCYLKAMINFILDKENKDSKSIIFMNKRTITKEINNAINRELLQFDSCLKSTFVVGISSQSESSSGQILKFSEKELKENINNFRNKDNYNILIATNVVEEGIDIPQCNNVICLSELVTVKEYIQKSGRARKENSKIYLFTNKKNENEIRDNFNQIVLSKKVMKDLVQNNLIKPKFKNYNYIPNYNYYETIKGSRCFESYASRVVNEFVSKLYNDGYNFVRCLYKCDITSNKKYIPYLSLPANLESNFQRIYDNSKKCFDTEEKAKNYFNKYQNYYYLKALKLLHNNLYLDDYLQFNKNYDNLISLENNFIKCETEPKIQIVKQENNNNISNDNYVEYIAHVIELTPGYFDINYSEKGQRFLALLSDRPLTLVNFDLFIPTSLLIKLYYFNQNFTNNNETEEQRDQWFCKKPKLPFNRYSKINLSMNECIKIKVPKNKIDYLNFFYTFSLFMSTDAEMFFYYSIYTKKFDFCKTLFTNNEKLERAFKILFDKYNSEFLKAKHHLNSYALSELNYQNHMIKISLLQYDKSSNIYTIDWKYIENCYKNVIKDIIDCALFYNICLVNEEEKMKLLKDNELLNQKTKDLEEILDKYYGENEPNIGMVTRNLLNFSKFFVLNFSEKDMKGTTKHSHGRFSNKDFTKQQYFLYRYGLLSNNERDYRKYLLLDYNMKLMKYKINLKNLGNVSKIFSLKIMVKKHYFFPNEVMQPIKFATIDQLYLYTLFPIMLFKVQNSLIYYYNTNILMNEFKLSFENLKYLNIKLIMQCLNAKSTMELDNYERLEFLGDSILKLLSSIEIFNTYKDGNRDLLFSKRKILENNKNLFEKGSIKELFKVLFTSPITIKRVMIPGFTKDESLIFGISYNKSFTKNCYLRKRQVIINDDNEILDKDDVLEEDDDEPNNNKINIKDSINEEEEEDEDELSKKQEEKRQNKIKKIREINPKKEKSGSEINYMKIDEEDEIVNEKTADRTIFEINYDNNNPESFIPNIPLQVTRDQIQELSNNQITVEKTNTSRFIYTKTLADIVESLTGFIYDTSLYNKQSLTDSLNNASIFLNEMDILKNTFNESLSKITNVALENLLNKNCVFDDESKKMKFKFLLEHGKYNFKHCELLYQAMTHATLLTDENIDKNKNYVNKSYQRLAFLGEAIIEYYVSDFVYKNNILGTECELHKMRICGINHHIISLIALELKLDDFLLGCEHEILVDITKYKKAIADFKKNASEKGGSIYKIPDEELLDENFVIILCELFQSYIAAVFIDCCDLNKTISVLDEIMLNYLTNNATKDTYTEHPKVTILEEFNKRKQHLKKIRENGGNRVIIKFGGGNTEKQKFRKQKLYNYQLIIDKFIIYEENISYNRTTIKKAQEKAKEVFLSICKEIDRRERLRLHESKFNLKDILDYKKINYKIVNS